MTELYNNIERVLEVVVEKVSQYTCVLDEVGAIVSKEGIV